MNRKGPPAGRLTGMHDIQRHSIHAGLTSKSVAQTVVRKIVNTSGGASGIHRPLLFTLLPAFAIARKHGFCRCAAFSNAFEKFSCFSTQVNSALQAVFAFRYMHGTINCIEVCNVEQPPTLHPSWTGAKPARQRSANSRSSARGWQLGGWASSTLPTPLASQVERTIQR